MKFNAKDNTKDNVLVDVTRPIKILSMDPQPRTQSLKIYITVFSYPLRVEIQVLHTKLLRPKIHSS
jgi:hypothetical protein